MTSIHLEQGPHCGRCGHPQDWHRLDDAEEGDPSDPSTPFRCIGYDCMKPGYPGGAEAACGCPDFVSESEKP